jgi:hypothetical protein
MFTKRPSFGQYYRYYQKGHVYQAIPEESRMHQ